MEDSEEKIQEILPYAEVKFLFVLFFTRFL